MKAVVYGASKSGYYASEMLKLKGIEVDFLIDKLGRRVDPRFTNNIPVYSSIEEVPCKRIRDIELCVVGLGNKTEAKQIKSSLEKRLNCKILTVHERPFESLYSLINEYSNKLEVGYLKESGYFQSIITESSVDKQGNPIPWLTYPCIEFLESRIVDSMSVLEYGMGNSTLWWKKRVSTVISIEHDLKWFKKITQQNPELQGVFVELEYNGDYCREVLKYNELDIAIIDGRDRVNCVKNSVKSLKSSGVIIWDDTDRESYSEGIELLKQQGFKQLDFVGMKPMSQYKSQTSIFYKDDNCLGI